MNIGIFYFSATGITELVSNHIALVIESEGHSVFQKNIITPESRQQEFDFLELDAYFFGFPVFEGRAPTVAEEWMKTLEGKNKKCSMYFTYGARDLELAHQATFYLLKKANFQVVLSAEFIGKHSFCVAKGFELAKGRPNQLDFDIVIKFVEESLARFQKDTEFNIDLSSFSYKSKRTREKTGIMSIFYPSRGGEDCSMCNLCENECPVEAFDAISGETDRKLCIHCMHCVIICPDNLLNVGEATKVYKVFTDKLGLSKDVVEKKMSKIIF
jgi:flavodoxin/Pyruvate/2-oxoacid:ferredoxin oxidoreductase delta subunit